MSGDARTGAEIYEDMILHSGRTNYIYISPSDFVTYKASNMAQYEPKKKPSKPHAAYIGNSPWGRRKKR